MREETRGRLAAIERMIKFFGWEGRDNEPKWEVDVLATVAGDCDRMPTGLSAESPLAAGCLS